MATIVTRAGKGSALTFNEADANFTNLNTAKLENIVEDTTPQLGGNLDTNNNTILNASSGVVRIGNGSTDGLVVDGTGGINVKNGNIFTDTTNQGITIQGNGTGAIVLNSNLTASNAATFSNTITANGNTTFNALVDFGTTGYLKNHKEYIIEIGGGSGVSGTFAPDAANAPIQYLPLTGNITINGFTNGLPGQTITMLLDGTLGSYTLTLGANILVPGGTAAITAGGYDLLTMTLIDDTAPLYIATIVNDFQ